MVIQSDLGQLVGGGEADCLPLLWHCPFPLEFFTCFPAAHLTRMSSAKK